jgi:hypothetical protein
MAIWRLGGTLEGCVPVTFFSETGARKRYNGGFCGVCMYIKMTVFFTFIRLIIIDQ